MSRKFSEEYAEMKREKRKIYMREYMRKKRASDPEHCEKHRQRCNEYKAKNKAKIKEQRHAYYERTGR